jgi:hypothetical protein
LASLVLIVLAVAALILPPIFMVAALRRGSRVGTGLIGAAYLGYLYWIWRRVSRPPRNHD